MELNNVFEVTAPIDSVWAVLTDVERIAPCLPGAQLQEVEGDEYRGIVKVKVGPISAQYKGAASFLEKDDEAHRAVLRAEGRDTRGAGNASADIVAELTETSNGTQVSVTTELTVTGKVAQFGRGVMADVSKKMMGQFADNLSGLLDDKESSQEAVGVAESDPSDEKFSPEEVSGVRTIDSPETAAVDLLNAAGAPIFKRLLPWIVLLAIGVIVWVVV